MTPARQRFLQLLEEEAIRTVQDLMGHASVEPNGDGLALPARRVAAAAAIKPP